MVFAAMVRGMLLLFLLGVFLASHCQADLSSAEKASIKAGFDAGGQFVDKIASFGDPKKAKVFNTLGKMASFLGAAGGFVSFILVFLPTRDSAELTYMKKQFTVVNTKLDKITSELDNLKHLITFENQRAAYLPPSHAILNGYKELGNFINEVQRTRCSKSTCKRVRARIASRYIKFFNVKSQLGQILHGTAQRTSVFGEPLLLLVKRAFQCDFSKVNQFANGVLKLAFKGQQVILAYEKLMGSRHSITQSMNDWLTNVYRLRTKSYSITNQCLKPRLLKAQLLKDIRKSDYQIGSATNNIANRKVKAFLERKYPWVNVVAFSYGAYGSNEHCTTDIYGGYWSMPKDRNARKRNLIIGFSDKTGTYVNQKFKVLRALRTISSNTIFYHRTFDYCNILKNLRTELRTENVWKYVASLNIHKVNSGLNIVADNDLRYLSGSYSLKWKRFRRVRKNNPLRSTSVQIVIVLKSEEQASARGCKLACKNGGQCKLYPFSSAQSCQCKPFYQGSLCQNHAKAELASSIDAMLVVTLQIPVLSDVAFDVKDLRRFVGVSFANMQKSISNLESSMQRKFDQLSKNINDKFKWANFITMYKDAIQNIEYYAHRFQRLSKENKDKNSLQISGKRLSAAVLHANSGIRKSLFQLNNLLVGKVNKPLLNHKPILLAFMESRSRAGEPCTASYKRAVDNYWKQLILLQQLGYMVWAQALEFAGRKSNIASTTYKERVKKQLSAIKKSTCQYHIRHSANVQCNKHYLHPGMVIRNRCNRNYYVHGSSQTSCTRKRSSCAACHCYRYGSVTWACTDIHGQCRCKRGFYGKKCNNRNCVWSNWSRYGHCLRCGYGARKLRRRRIQVPHIGRGRRCHGPSVSYANCFKGCCRNQFHCSSRRKCIPYSQRCNYDNNCGDKQDERYCNEHCYVRYTWLSAYGHGNLVYLDRHRPNCGNGAALKMFHLQRIGGRIRYQFICCRLLKSYICYNRAKYNRFTYASHHSRTYELRHQSVSCGGNSYISSFALQRNNRHNHIRYAYNCCHLRYWSHRRRMTCYARHTHWTADGHGKNFFLDRQTVRCAHRYFLNTFQLQWRKGAWWGQGSWRYYYRCCKINV